MNKLERIYRRGTLVALLIIPSICLAQMLMISGGRGTGPAGDTTPAQFTFTEQTDVDLATTITSAPITVSGINAPSTITVSGGTYDVNASGSFTSSSGTV